MAINYQVSVIIPTMNRSDEMVECLISILDSNYKNVDIHW